MAVTQNTYTGNGATVLYSFTFPYLETTDVKVTINGTPTTAYTFANATTIQFNTAPANGAAIRIYRDTDDASLAATFYSGSAIRAQDLNDNFTQNLYVTQEVNNNSVNIDGSNPMVGNLNMNGFQIDNLAFPTSGADSATKDYVDSVLTSSTPYFVQNGTGAVTRSWDSKLKDIVSVLDFIPQSEHAAIKAGTSTYNAAANIQAAIDAVTAAGGGTVYIPEGGYFIGTTSLRCRYANVSIIGDCGASVINTASTMTSPALYWGEDGYTPRPQNSVLRGITIDGNGSSNANAHGISVWASLSTIRDCHVKNCGGAGMYFYLSWTMWVEYNHIYGCGTGVYIGQECNNFTFFSNEINWCTGHGIHVNGGHGVRIQNNGVEECQKYGLYVQGNPLSAIRTVVYEGNYHERNAKNASFPYEVYVDKGSAEISNVVLRNNYITNDQSPTRDVRIHSVNSASIEGNTLQGLTTQNVTSRDVATAYGISSPVRHYYGTAVPATGTYGVGDIVWNTNPASTTTTPAGWICITAGTPGAWRRFGHVSPASQTNADLYGQFYFDITLQAISGYVAQLVNTRGAADTGGHVLYLDAYRSDTTNTRLIGTRDDKWILYSNGTVGGTSDVTLKKNIETTRDGYLEDLNQLRVVKYNWLTQDDDSPKELGLIAQEVETVFPGLVQEAENAEGQNIKSIKTSVLPYMLLKALQEATERIKTLEEKVAELS